MGQSSPKYILMAYHTFCDIIYIYLLKLVASNFRPKLEIFLIKIKIISPSYGPQKYKKFGIPLVP